MTNRMRGFSLKYTVFSTIVLLRNIIEEKIVVKRGKGRPR